VKGLLKTFAFCVAVLTFAFYVLRFNCLAQSVSSNELINNAKQYDGKIVTYEGEAIGDIMNRADFAWVNINDGNNAIGIWISGPLAKSINYTGSYKTKGDRIEITGVFHRACPEHGGDLDIHAQAIRKTGTGRIIPEELNIGKRHFAVILLGVLGIIWILSLSGSK
jgi:hypothetical protein